MFTASFNKKIILEKQKIVEFDERQNKENDLLNDWNKPIDNKSDAKVSINYAVVNIFNCHHHCWRILCSSKQIQAKDIFKWNESDLFF